MTGPILFHVSVVGLPDGAMLSPGRYGAMTRTFRPGTAADVDGLRTFAWEFALETARQTCRPGAVSRLNCLFASETLDAARAFRDRYRKGHSVYEIEPHPGSRLFRRDFGLLSAGVQGGPFVDTYPLVAIRYWRDEPGEQIEVLIGGSAIVRRLVPD